MRYIDKWIEEDKDEINVDTRTYKCKVTIIYYDGLQTYLCIFDAGGKKSPFFVLIFSLVLFLCNDGRKDPTVEG